MTDERHYRHPLSSPAIPSWPVTSHMDLASIPDDARTAEPPLFPGPVRQRDRTVRQM